MAQQHQLFLTAAAWERLPESLRDPVHARIADANRQALERIAALGGGRGDLPARLDRPGPACAWWERSFRLLLERRTVAWRLGDPGQLAEALADVEALLARPDWTPHAPGGHGLHADLKTGDLAYCCAFALDCLPLPASLRAGLLRRLRDDCLLPYLAGIAAGDWWRRADFNWGPALHGNCGLAALAIRADEPRLSSAVLAAARDGVACALEGYRPGGGWVEGLMYHATHLGHLTDFAAAHHRATGDDLGVTAVGAIAATLDARMAMRLPDGRPVSFSGCSEHTVEWFSPQAWWWAQRLGRPEWTAFEDGLLKPWWDAHGLFHDVAAFWYRPAGAQARTAEPPALSHAAGVDWLVWRGAGAWLALRGGDNGGNRANRDLGAFILGFGDERCCCDPGWGCVGTGLHACVTVRGQDQAEAVAPIVRHRHGEGWLYAVVDLGACFPGSLERHCRHLLLMDGAELLIVDDLLGRRGGRCGARFHLQTALRAEIRDGAFLMRGVRDVHVVPDACTHARIDERSDAEAGRPYRTLSWAAAVDAPRTLHRWSIAVDAPPAAVVERTDDVLTVARRGRRWRLELDALRAELLP